MSFCPNCGKELVQDARFCSGCGSAVSTETTKDVFCVRNENVVETNLDRKGTFGVLSDRWAWAMVSCDICGLLVWIIDKASGESTFFLAFFLVILRIIFWRFDVGELKLKGYTLGGWNWFGLILDPVYFFIRVSKTTKKNYCAIISCVVTVLPLIITISTTSGSHEYSETASTQNDTNSISASIVQKDSFVMELGDAEDTKTAKKSISTVNNSRSVAKPVVQQPKYSKNDFAADIDAILTSGSDGDVGRNGVSGIGYGNIDDKLGRLKGGNDEIYNSQKTQTLPTSRSRASIQRVTMQNMAALRYAYNKRLREKPGLFGQISVKFAIDESGKVIYAQIAESTMADLELETIVVSKVKSWTFEKIDKPGDVTEVTYPFVFSQ